MQLLKIQQKIQKNTSILKIATSLKLMCMTRLKQLKIQKTSLNQHIKYIQEKIISREITSTGQKKIKKESLTISINIFLFTDMSFCGNFNKKNLYSLQMCQKNQDQIYVVGIKGEKFMGSLPKENYMGKLYDKNILNILYNFITNYKEPLKINLYTYNQMEVIYYNNYSGNFYEKCYLKYLLAAHMVDFKYEESRTRLMKVTTAINNSEVLQNILKLMYNKTRQSIITRDLLEIISGSQIEEEK